MKDYSRIMFTYIYYFVSGDIAVGCYIQDSEEICSDPDYVPKKDFSNLSTSYSSDSILEDHLLSSEINRQTENVSTSLREN